MSLDSFDHHLDPEQNPEEESRGIHYSALTLEGCLVEVFGDDGLISTQDRRLGALRVERSLRLLDLHGEGAWKAGNPGDLQLSLSCHLPGMGPLLL